MQCTENSTHKLFMCAVLSTLHYKLLNLLDLLITTLLAERFFLASLLACTKSFAFLVFCVVGLFYPEVNKPTTRNAIGEHF